MVKMLAGLVRPCSRGHLRVAGPNPTDTIEIVSNTLAGSADMKALIRAIELCREIGNSSAMSRFAKREVMPGNNSGRARELREKRSIRLLAPSLHGQNGPRSNVRC